MSLPESPSPEQSHQTEEKISFIIAQIGGGLALLSAAIGLAYFLWGKGYPWLGFSAAVFGFSFIAWFLVLSDALNRVKKLAWVEKLGMVGFYRRVLMPVLEWLDQMFSEDIERRQYPVVFYWSADLFGFCLLLAIGYPVLSLIGQWLLTGKSASLGGLLVFEPLTDFPDWVFALSLLMLVLVFFCLSRMLYSNVFLPFFIRLTTAYSCILLIWYAARGDMGEVLLLIAGFVTFLVAFIAIFFVSAFCINIMRVSDRWAFIAAPLSAITLAVFFATSFAAVLAIALSCVFVIAFAHSGTFTIAGFIATTIAFIVAVVFTIDVNAVLIIIIGGGCVFVFGLYFSRFGKKYLENHFPLRILGYLVVLLMLLGLIVDASELDVNLGSSVLLFLVVFPLTNAFFDYLSIGLTRRLLYGSLNSSSPAIKGFVDVVGACILFLGLKLTLVLWLTLVADFNGQSLLELSGENSLFDALRSHPEDYIWLYLTLFSTLIPTVLHINLACFSLIATHVKPIPALLNGLIKPLYEPGKDRLLTVAATLGLCLVTTLFLVGPIAALSHLWQFLWPLLTGSNSEPLFALLGMAESWSEWLSAWKASW